jgi:RNA-binding protein YhbY
MTVSNQSQCLLAIMILACLGIARAFVVPIQSSCTMTGCHSIKRQSFNLRPTFITAVSMAEEEDIDFLFEDHDDEPTTATAPEPELPLDAQEKVWRYANKPLLRIGTKGATLTHGNSLKNLLKDHVVVKVKVNTKKFGKLKKYMIGVSRLYALHCTILQYITLH